MTTVRENNLRRGGLNKSQLQIIAVIAMVIDHVSYFVPMPWFYLCHFVGRITIVIMSYFVAEGYYMTHDLNKYICRMGVFAAVSQIPFYLFVMGKNLPHTPISLLAGMFYSRNVIFTLFIGLCLLTILKSGYNILLKLLAVFAAWKLTQHSDWDWFCLMWVCSFGLLRGNTKGQMAAATAIVFMRFVKIILPVAIVIIRNIHSGVDIGLLFFVVISNAQNTIIWSLVQFGGLLAIPLLKRYNGEKGRALGLSFYIFYPAHLIVLFILKILTV